MIVQREGGFHVLSEKGKNLGGPYKTREEAATRLRQVEYFKHHKTAALKKLGFVKRALSPELLERASNKASELAELHRKNFKSFWDTAERSGETKWIAAAEHEAGLAKKKSTQSINFLMGKLR